MSQITQQVTVTEQYYAEDSCKSRQMHGLPFHLTLLNESTVLKDSGISGTSGTSGTSGISSGGGGGGGGGEGERRGGTGGGGGGGGGGEGRRLGSVGGGGGGGGGGHGLGWALAVLATRSSLHRQQQQQQRGCERACFSFWQGPLDETPNHKQRSRTLPITLLFAPAAGYGQEDVGGDSQVPGETSAPDHLATQARRALLPNCQCSQCHRGSLWRVKMWESLPLNHSFTEGRGRTCIADEFPGPTPFAHMFGHVGLLAGYGAAHPYGCFLI
jgi:hypothetical protein